jgi:hypothetical protein
MQASRLLFLLLGLAALFSTSCQNRTAPEAPPPHAFYVDPARGDDTSGGTSPDTAFRTLERARDAVRATLPRQSADIVVHLRGGTYARTEPFLLDDRDSGRHGHLVRYQAFENETPVLDGGRRLTGWSAFDAAKNIHRVRAPGLATRQLFVNGTRATRARSTGGLANATFDAIGHTTTDTFLATFRAPRELQFVYERIWTMPRNQVDSITVTNGVARIVMQQPGWRWNRNKLATSVQLPKYYENAFELLDQPGEWYLDRTGVVDPAAPGTLYYIPRKGEDLASAEVVAPVAEKLLVAAGRSLDTPLTHLELRGLSFQYTTYLRPDAANGHPDAQNNVIREEGVKGPDGVYTFREFIIDGAALTLRYARDLTLERLRFERLGGNGVNAFAGVSHSTFCGGLYRDVGGTGIQIGDYTGFLDPRSENYAFLLDPDRTDLDHRLVNRELTVSNNYLHRCGVDFPSSTAISLAFPVDSRVVHNEIEEMPYTGIHLGWAWTRLPRTSMGGNLIAHNYVNNVMRVLNDGGCIYVLGPQRGPDAYSVIRDNYVTRCSNQGIYLDDGASYYRVQDNVIAAIGDKPVKIVHLNKHDVDVVRTYSSKPLGEFRAPRVTVEPAILRIDRKWAPEAQAIIEKSGLEPGYRDLNPAPKFIYGG